MGILWASQRVRGLGRWVGDFGFFEYGVQLLFQPQCEMYESSTPYLNRLRSLASWYIFVPQAA